MSQKTSIDYELFIQNAVRRAMHDLMLNVSLNGLPGKHHFYIDFMTQYPGVELSAALKEEYPDDMTIALQYEYWDLVVEDASFSVTLAFDEDEERITIPFNAILKFTDPSVDFGVEFAPDMSRFDSSEVQAFLEELSTEEKNSKPLADGENNIISFDVFKKK